MLFQLEQMGKDTVFTLEMAKGVQSNIRKSRLGLRKRVPLAGPQLRKQRDLVVGLGIQRDRIAALSLASRVTLLI